MSKTSLRLAAALLALTGLPVSSRAQAAPAPMFPFVMPWDDSTPGTVTDVSWLNAKPAGVNGFIVPKGGHFVESKTGRRVRFLAINFSARQAFPDHTDAEKIAAHLAKQGYNLIRLQHLDNAWGDAAGTLIDPAYPDHQHLSAAQFDRLDYLLAQLKKNGVYTNINLHVDRQFSPADGFPDSVGKIPFVFDKRVDEYDPRMIELQKNYARDLLTHVNPYTGLAYAQDPAVAVVEINNENSLVGDPWATPGAGLDAVPEPFRGELVGLWNAWLLKKHGTDAKVQAAWTRGLAAAGPGLIHSDTPWTSEQHESAQLDFSPAPGDHPSLGAPDIDARIAKADGTGWHVQVHQSGLDLHSGDTYTVSFRAKADVPRPVNVVARLDQADYHIVGLDQNAALTTDWKAFSYVFTAQNTAPNHDRIAFNLGNAGGTVSIQDLQVHPGASDAGLPPGQSLSQKNVDIPNIGLKAQSEDWVAFLADTERAYAEGMRAYLKTDLHVRANVICSQMGYGGLTSLTREANMDFADNHAYWQHPTFPHAAWDQKDWLIPNTPMVSDLANGGGTLRDLAEYRVAGKPYSVSEYNHPAPNDYRAEMMPELATFAAFQDWDEIALFDHGGYGAGATTDRVNGFFDTTNDPSRAAFIPAAAMIFRTGLVYPAFGENNRTLSDLANQDQTKPMSNVWRDAGQFYKPDVFTSRLAVRSGPRIGEAGSGGKPPPILVSGTGSSAQFLMDGYAATALAGYVGGRTVVLRFGSLTFPAFGNNFAAMTLTAMDRRQIVVSDRLLLTLVGKVENQGMGWNADRTSVGDQWGHGPVMAEGVPATVSLKTDGGARHVWALDSTGKRATEVPATYAKGVLTFTVGPQFKTLWYEVGE